jgi:hypothetical protein
MIGTQDDPEALPAALRALGKEIKSNGCPGFDQIVHAVADAIRSPEPRTARLHAIKRLESIRLHHGHDNTEVAAAYARQILANASALIPASPETMDDGELRIQTGALILAGLADASMCPAAHLSELVNELMISFQEIRSRRQNARGLIAAAPETRRLGVQLLLDPSGASVRQPRIPRVKQSQAEILTTALTE